MLSGLQPDSLIYSPGSGLDGISRHPAEGTEIFEDTKVIAYLFSQAVIVLLSPLRALRVCSTSNASSMIFLTLVRLLETFVRRKDLMQQGSVIN